MPQGKLLWGASVEKARIVGLTLLRLTHVRDAIRNHKGDQYMSETPKLAMTRRFFVIAAPLGLAGCASTGDSPIGPSLTAAFGGTYGELEDNGVVIPAIDTSEIDPRFLRQTVDYSGRQPAGSIIIDTPNRNVYFVRPDRKAVRYGCGVGRAGWEFKGSGFIGRTAVWPRWSPTPNMLAAMPERYGPVRGGMAGGIDNPLGARALYLHRDGQESNYRIHGTNEPETIGSAVSSGCIRMFNHDVIDLHKRVVVGARVIVIQSGSVMSA
jgi:lipoprotein-anchoring transpeptidase ErfK/SrfK